MPRRTASVLTVIGWGPLALMLAVGAPSSVAAQTSGETPETETPETETGDTEAGGAEAGGGEAVEEPRGLGLGGTVLMFSEDQLAEFEAARAAHEAAALAALQPAPPEPGGQTPSEPPDVTDPLPPDPMLTPGLPSLPPLPDVTPPPPPPPLPTVYLGGLSYAGPSAWTIWINGQRIDSVNLETAEFEVLAIDRGGVMLRWVPPLDPREFRFALRPNQTYLPYSNRIEDGRVADDPARPADALQ